MKKFYNYKNHEKISNQKIPRNFEKSQFSHGIFFWRLSHYFFQIKFSLARLPDICSHARQTAGVYVEMLSKTGIFQRTQALEGSRVGSGRTNESFSAKIRLHWTCLCTERGRKIYIIGVNQRCFCPKKFDRLMQSSFKVK